jgi:hypothetical protein
MKPLRKLRFCLFALAVIAVVPSLSAVVVEFREWHGKQIQCMHGGNSLNPIQICGTQFYARVFTGTVKSAVDITDTDKLLVLIPDEIFLGGPFSEVTATVNQACLPQNRPEIEVGDKWLFYLRTKEYLHRDEKTPHLTSDGFELPFDSPSRSLSQAQDEIAMLRHLARLTDSGILRGNLTRTVSKNPWKFAPVPNHKVLATRASDGAEYAALTDGDGHYEFELPPDSYRLTANSGRGLWAPEGTINVWRHSCIGFNFLLHTDGRISGTVTEADGKPARFGK